MEPVEGVQVARQDLLHPEVVQAAFQDHPVPQAEALVWQAEVVVLLHQARLHQKNNLKKAYYESENTFGYTIPM